MGPPLADGGPPPPATANLSSTKLSSSSSSAPWAERNSPKSMDSFEATDPGPDCSADAEPECSPERRSDIALRFFTATASFAFVDGATDPKNGAFSSLAGTGGFFPFEFEEVRDDAVASIVSPAARDVVETTQK